MKYGPEKTKEICELLAQGNSRNDAFLLADVSQSTFYEWMQLPEFSEKIKKAELSCKSFHINIIRKAAEKTWQAAAWWLERKHSDEFALKQKEHTVSPDAALKMAETTLRLMRELNASGTPNTEHARV